MANFKPGQVLRSCILSMGFVAACGSHAGAQVDPLPTEATVEAPAQPPSPVSAEMVPPEGASEAVVPVVPSGEGPVDFEPLMRGPVHEAFATPFDADPAANPREFDKAPPDPIDEQPPQPRPADQGLTWIPGYWAWNDGTDDYVWVSGLYRRIPPGRSWNPGYWTQTESGYQWISGYWGSTQSTDQTATYLPPPPKSIDNGPSVPAPGDNYFWVPGRWEYVQGVYVWRSGFWSKQPSSWVWQPPCYLNTPNGYLSVDGYWDYLPTNRGRMYAPVTFYNSVYLRPRYVYRPYYPLASVHTLLLQLFVRRGCPYYYYGNFYGPSYLSLGFHPWYRTGYSYRYHTPWLGYYHGHYRKSGISFVDSMHRYGQRFDGTRKHAASTATLPKRAGGRDAIGGNRRSIDSVGRVAIPGRQPRGMRTMDDIVRSRPNRVDIVRNQSGTRAAARSGGNPLTTPSFPSSGRSGLGNTVRRLQMGMSPSTRTERTTDGNSLPRGRASSADRSSRSVTPSRSISRAEPTINRGSITRGAPTINRGPTVNRAPTVNRDPTINRSPTVNRGSPTITRGAPTINRSRTINRSPTVNRSPAINRSPTVNRSARPTPSFGRLSELSRQSAARSSRSSPSVNRSTRPSTVRNPSPSVRRSAPRPSSVGRGRSSGGGGGASRGSGGRPSRGFDAMRPGRRGKK